MDDSALAAHELGLVLTDEAIQSLDALGDRMDVNKQRFNVGFSQIAEWGIKAWDKLFNASEMAFQGMIQFKRGFEGTGTFDEKLQRGIDGATTAVEETAKTQDSEAAAVKAANDKKRKARLAPPDFTGIKSDAGRTESSFKSSASGSIAAAGGYFLGSGQTAAMDLAKQALDIAKKTEMNTARIANQGVTIKQDQNDI
jgi:hypothetical protein